MDNNDLENQNEETKKNEEEIVDTNEENMADKVENITNIDESNTSNGTIKISLKSLVLFFAGIFAVGVLGSIVYIQTSKTETIDNVNQYNSNRYIEERNSNVNQYDTNRDLEERNSYHNGSSRFTLDMAKKPIIYIYPEQRKEVSVKLGKTENLTCTYPKYEEDGWKVVANPNGDLVDIKTGRNLYALYWEGKNEKCYDYEKADKENELEGFVIKGENTAEFLEEKLEILGLNERESEEFIVYWLPQMEKNKYNYIRFETEEEIEKEMPLEIDPKPETTIRVLMDWKALDEEIEVKEQKLEKVERKGYTVVEWGGSILNEK